MTGSRTIVAAVLAAGSARRFGSDKLIQLLRGKALAAHIADVIAGVNVTHRVAVCPAGNAERAAIFASRGFEIITNDEPERGMGSSLALAAARAVALDADGLLVCLADMPNVTVEHLRALIEMSGGRDVVATEADGVRSPPAVFGRARLGALSGLSGDRGAKQLLDRAALITATPEMVRDIDRPEDLEQTAPPTRSRDGLSKR